MEPRAAKFGLTGFGCSAITRLAREGGGLEGIWLEPSDTMLMVRRILSAEASGAPDELLGWFRQTQEPAGQIDPMSSASNGWSAFYHG